MLIGRCNNMRNQIIFKSPTTHFGVICSGSNNTTVNGKPLSRKGDIHVCPFHGVNAIALGSDNTTTNNEPNARFMDPCFCGAGCLPPSFNTFTN